MFLPGRRAGVGGASSSAMAVVGAAITTIPSAFECQFKMSFLQVSRLSAGIASTVIAFGSGLFDKQLAPIEFLLIHVLNGFKSLLRLGIRLYIKLNHYNEAESALP